MIRAVAPFVILPLVALGLVLDVGASRAAPAERLAVALSCPADVAGPDCSRATALDVLAQPASEGECPKVAQLLATHLDLPAGGYHKLACERRKG